MMKFMLLFSLLLVAQLGFSADLPKNFYVENPDLELSPFEGEVNFELQDLIAQAGKAPAISNKKVQSKMAEWLRKGRSLATAGQYEEASQLYFSMSRSPHFRAQQTEIKYVLGLMLFEMKLYQTSGFLFYDVIQSEVKSGRRTKYMRLALEKLSLITNYLESDVLLKFAVGKVSADEFPANQKDLFYYRLADLKLGEKNFEEAASIFGRIPKSSTYYPNSKYKQGMAFAELGQVDKAISSFSDLEEYSSPKGIRDSNRVNALMGKARTYYQKKDFERATELYRDVPRDTFQWHDSMFERSWSMLRTGQFRSALSQFQTLHSAYYKDFYLPETLILRSIVYLYICRWEEMEKTLDLYDRVYKPIQKDIQNILTSKVSTEGMYSDTWKASRYVRSGQVRTEDPPKTGLPYLIYRHINRDGDVQQATKYLERLENEEAIAKKLSTKWQKSGVGQYALRTINRRIASTRGALSRLTRKQLLIIRNDLRDLTEQADFLRLEQVTGQKESVKKKIAGKGLQRQQVDADTARDFYVDNGYEYWPFQGEYWLDELGNYHYVGVSNCEK